MIRDLSQAGASLGALFAGAVLATALTACIPGEDEGWGQACGSRGLSSCPRGEYCEFPLSASCGETDRPGMCEERPTTCTREYAPVCGCDGETYGNSCMAAAAGVSVRSRGECEPEEPAASCGGLTGADCPRGQFCDYPLEALCGAADQTGTCREIPDGCITVYAPVCGCDDRTYGNSCEAARAGVSVSAEGPCDGGDGGDGGIAEGSVCGGIAGLPCPDALYCAFPIEANCGAADRTGTCQRRPEVCTLQYDPVCGCDDRTYGNACAAAGAGVSIAYEGECRN